MAGTAVTLNDLGGHSPVAGIFKCNPLCSILHDFNWQCARTVPLYQQSFFLFLASAIAFPMREAFCGCDAECQTRLFTTESVILPKLPLHPQQVLKFRASNTRQRWKMIIRSRNFVTFLSADCIAQFAPTKIVCWRDLKRCKYCVSCTAIGYADVDAPSGGWVKRSSAGQALFGCSDRLRTRKLRSVDQSHQTAVIFMARSRSL